MHPQRWAGHSGLGRWARLRANALTTGHQRLRHVGGGGLDGGAVMAGSTELVDELVVGSGLVVAGWYDKRQPICFLGP